MMDEFGKLLGTSGTMENRGFPLRIRLQGSDSGAGGFAHWSQAKN